VTADKLQRLGHSCPITTANPLRAPEPIQFPDHKDVGFAQLGQSLIQSRTPDLRAAEFVGENAFASCFLERVQLHFEILVMGGHSGVPIRRG
jgi:hypothetical protein